jgi:hypothetical protein
MKHKHIFCKTNTLKILIIGCLTLGNSATLGKPCNLKEPWQVLCPMIAQRLTQIAQKMKLNETEVTQFEQFINATKYDFTNIQHLQPSMPKTSLELLMAVSFRNVAPNETEAMAAYLQRLIATCDFKNLKAFDNNTSHIIGRDWPQIDYSGERMTWQNQKKHYESYGIHNFKTEKHLKLFFPVESTLPYFTKIYQPKENCVKFMHE